MQIRVGEIEQYGVKAKGKMELIHHLGSKVLQRGQAITAKCYDCMGYFSDGKVDCLTESCPLYTFMPYKGKRDR